MFRFLVHSLALLGNKTGAQPLVQLIANNFCLFIQIQSQNIETALGILLTSPQ
jgi:urocanate hydratase